MRGAALDQRHQIAVRAAAAEPLRDGAGQDTLRMALGIKPVAELVGKFVRERTAIAAPLAELGRSRTGSIRR
jgi:hypothetical protein